MQLEPVELDLNLAEALSRNKRRWDAYERLLLDVIEGDSTLFMRRDESRGRLGLGRPDPRRLARALPEPAALPGRQQRPGTGATAAGTAGSTLAGMTRTLIRLRIARRALG